MKKFMKTIKIIATILFLICVVYFFWFKVTIDSKMSGSLLNSESKIIDGRYFLADNDGTLNEIEKDLWDSLVIKTNILKLSTLYLAIYLIYFWSKYLIWPNMKKLIKSF